MFIETLFTVARIWKQRKCLSADEWIKKKDVRNVHNGILLSQKKEQNNATGSNMDRSRGYHIDSK